MSTEVVVKQHTLKIRDQLVASIDKQDVPNHLLNSKTYAKLQRNEYFEIQPAEVHFSGFEVDRNLAKKFYCQIVRVINKSDQVQRMTVLPPSSKYFEINYVKPDRLVPGFALDIQITFKPEEYKYYNDAIRIHSKGDENLIIPIHAYPIISSFNFPQEYKFPNTPVGKSVTRNFTLKSTAPVIFEFAIEVLDRHPSFQISPLAGIIPYNEDTTISVTFTPTEFCTAILMVQLIVSQFNSKPIVCKFYGISTPGLSRDKQVKDLVNQDVRVLSPLDLARLKRQNRDLTKIESPNSNEQSMAIVDGLRFPKDLNSVWAISKVLNQKKGKLSLKELKANQSQSTKVNKQFKETQFLKNVLELEDEERRNQLKWQVKVGDSSIDNQARAEILASRSKAEYEYHLSIGEPILADELKRHRPAYKQCRTIRALDATPQVIHIDFDLFKNELWSTRHQASCKFNQVIRKIVIYNRLKSRLNSLKQFASDWLQATQEAQQEGTCLLIENFIDIYEKRLRGEKIEQDVTISCLNSRTIGTYYFPIADSDDTQDDNVRYCDRLSSIRQLDSLGLVNANPIEFSIDVQIPYLNLSVPKHYELNDYKIKVDTKYVNKYESRMANLRKGAQDELIEIDVGKTVEPFKETKLENDVKPASIQIIDVETPMNLLKENEYHPMHIFNPAPGLISYQKLLPYSGIEINHHLNPLPRFEREQFNTTQKKFLDHDDVIKGVMLWKKFPSQSLTSLSNTPTLTDVWVPRWSNVFSTNLLPLETPPLLADLPEDDKENLYEEQNESNQENGENAQIHLTPEMANAQFGIPQIFENRQQTLKEELLKRKKAKQFYSQSNISNDKLPPTNLPVSSDGPVMREQREQELEYFLNKQYNDLGLRIKSRINSLYNQAPGSAQNDAHLEQQSNTQENNNNIDENRFNSDSKTNLSLKDF